jgi:predicted glycosyltransferase
MSQLTTIVFQSPNHKGLGHIARLSNIALEIQRLATSIRIVFAVSGLDHPTLEVRHLPYVPLPLESPVFLPAWAAWPEDERLLINFRNCDATLEALNPSAIVFDCFPHSSFLKAAMKQRRPLILVLRAMKDIESYLAKWADFLSAVELFIVAEDKGAIKLPAIIENRSIIAGQISPPTSRVRWGRTERQQGHVLAITVTGGGGGSPNALSCYNFFLDALRHVQRMGRDFECTLVPGPLFKDWSGLHLFDRLKVLPFAPDMSALYSRSDLILSQAGYNTLLELRELPCRVICRPIDTAYDDQFARAAAVAKENPNIKVYDGADVAALASLICHHLDQPVIEATQRPSRGAEIAARAIVSLASQSRV